MYRITYVLGTNGALLEKNLKVLLAALTMVDRLYLLRHKETAPLYKSGVRYEEEYGDQDDWQDIPTTLAMGHGDAEDLACWRAAELQNQGVDAWPTLERDHGCLHPRVRYANGQVEDPARVLGMRGHTKPCLALTSGPKSAPETRVNFCMNVFRGSRAPQRDQNLAHHTLRLLLGALTLIDCDILRAYPQLPNLYDAGVRYEIEPAGREDWQDVITNFRRKTADCEDLASHRAAELQVRHGVQAWPSFTFRVRPNASHLYHIQTRYPDGATEDPPRVLGMGRNTGV